MITPTRCARRCDGACSRSSSLLTAVFLVPLLARDALRVRPHRRDPATGRVSTRAPFAGATIFGLAMFATLFLGVVLAVFLTLGVVHGDAERGLLQPLVVRPVGRAAAARPARRGCAVCTVYVVLVYTALLLMIGLIGNWWPDRVALRALELAVGVLVVAAVSLLGSIFLGPTANGIAIFMVFGSGLVAGLLGYIGDALDAETLKTASRVVSWALPFEALYQDEAARDHEEHGLAGFSSSSGLRRRHDAGPWLGPWVAAYAIAVPRSR